MNDKQDFYKGRLIIKFPDNDDYSININPYHVIEIKSKTLSCYQLFENLHTAVNNNINKIDTSSIDMKFLEPTCRGGYCERPILNMQCIIDNISFLDNGNSLPTSSIIVKPMLSKCNPDNARLNKNCEFISNEYYCHTNNKHHGNIKSCRLCASPYMKEFVKVANIMRIMQK